MDLSDSGANYIYLHRAGPQGARLWLEGPVTNVRDVSDNEGEIYWRAGSLKYILNVEFQRLYVQYERQAPANNNQNGRYDAMNFETSLTMRAIVAVCQYLNRMTGAVPNNYKVHYHVIRGHPLV